MRRLHKHQWIGLALAALMSAACTEPNKDEHVTTELTYWADAKPIIDKKCATCHVEGGVGAFALDDYERVDYAKDAMLAAILDNRMPPWQAAGGCNEYVNDFSLSKADRETLLEWLSSGTPEGDPSTEPEFVDDRPVLVPNVPPLRMPVAYEPPPGLTDELRCFVLDWKSDTTFATGFNFKPGNTEIVHHVVAYLATPDEMETFHKLDAADPASGYECFNGSGLTSTTFRWFGIWLPGVGDVVFPEDTGIKIQKGGGVILQVHYNMTTADPRPDQSEMNIRVADTVAKPTTLSPLSNPLWRKGDNMLIPEGAVAEYDYTVAVDSLPVKPGTIYGVGMHMHQLGQSARLMVRRKSGKEECLLQIDDWDFDWQASYYLKQPFQLKPGDELYLNCKFDNTAEGQPVINDERGEPRIVRWGEGSYDEMCAAIIHAGL